jgi:histidine triad (HIT) family protein
MSDSIFTRIIRREIPCHLLFENEHVIAFLDIAPLAPGHALVIPKRQVERLEQLPAEEAAEVARQLGPLAEKIVRLTGANGYNILQNNGPSAGQVVPHVHFHIIPRRDGDGLGFRWNAGSSRPDELSSLAEQIRRG